MSLFIDGFADLAFSGVPSSAVYDVLKQLWQKMSKRDWNNLFLDAFEQVIRDEQPRLQQYVKGDGDIDIDRGALSKILHQELDQDVLSPRYSELTNDGKVSVLVQAMVEQDVLILGGHSLSQTGYRHLIWNLVQKVKDKFKAAILQRPQLYQEVLLDETLGNRQVIEQASQYLSQEFNLIQSQLTAIERQINHLPSSIAADLSNNLSLPLALEHQAELNYARDLINQYNPQRALDYLLDLEQRIWHTAQPLVKYRLIANIGAAKLGLGRENEAAKHFIQALQFNPDDEKALYFAALGHILLRQEHLAKAIIERMLIHNPANENAYSLLVQISHSEDFEVVLESVPEAYRNSTDVAYALGSLAHHQSNDAQARHWFQVAIDNDTR
jgi:tetratricopeptide (TPR) repeat protein